MIIELQVLPAPSGTQSDRHAHVDAAIGEIARSGLTYEVGPLGTSVEGPADDLWRLARRVHEATLASGAQACVSIIKVAEGAGIPDRMGDLTDGHRT